MKNSIILNGHRVTRQNFAAFRCDKYCDFDERGLVEYYAARFVAPRYADGVTPIRQDSVAMDGSYAIWEIRSDWVTVTRDMRETVAAWGAAQ